MKVYRAQIDVVGLTTDPEWMVRRTTDLATAAADGSHAPSRAARATEAASAEITAGRAPAGSVGAARRYNYEASPKHGTQRVGNVSAAPRGDKPHSIHRCR